ncbi:MAG: phosphatase PAP2 family protein [Gemmatimonadota bacterium]|nr:phosphatase PAP2 family protein [Gemmatimonadota bacterium]
MNLTPLLRILLAVSLAIATGVLAPPASAQISQRDSVAATRPWVTKRDAVAGALAILATVAIAPLDGRAARELQEQQFQRSDDLQQTARQLAFAGGPGPFLVGAGLFAAGRLSRMPRVADAGLHMTEAVILAASFTGLGKGIFGRALPNVNVNNPDDFQFFRGFHEKNGPFVSFPSGHAAASFAVAAVVTGEFDQWYPGQARLVGPIAYGGAALVGLARMYQNVHWASDLPLAAAIGTWSGLTVLARSHIRRQRAGTQKPDFTDGLIEVLRSTSVVPITAHGVGLSWSIPFRGSTW